MRKLHLGLLAFLILSSQAAQARFVHVGLSGGLAWSTSEVLTFDGFSFVNQRMDSFDPVGGLTISLNQESVIGLHLAFDLFPAKTDPSTFSALVGVESATLGFNFNLSHNRHYLGVGACHAQYWNQKAPGAPVAGTGFTIEGKDYWPSKSGPSFFISARWHFPGGGGLSNSLLLQAGLDF
ncbi:MAG TPA: hypothetical protein VL588_10585 [Bdellovibrionota bacterium]|jgi:hypothetical protein|nr:hypothetical protein [Bdellovibrionota bacterium]